MNRLKLLLSSLLLLAGFASAMAQNIEVTGLVVDETGFPLPGVTILIPGTAHGTETDLDGRFKLSVPAGTKTVTAKCVGLEDQEITLTGQPLNITMKESSNFIDYVFKRLPY